MMMKKLTTVVILIMSISLSTMAQSIEITPFYGYQLNGNLKTYYNDFNMSNAPNYGGLLSVGVAEGTFAELMYIRSDTDFKYNYLGYTQATIDLSIEYYQIGAVKQIEVSDKVSPFGAFTLGATRFHPKDAHDWDDDGGATYLDDAWSFSATLGAGLKIYLSDRIGLRMQARMLMPMYFDGLFIGIGSGGASGGASFSIPVLSGDFTGGLIIRIGE